MREVFLQIFKSRYTGVESDNIKLNHCKIVRVETRSLWG